MTTLKGMTRAQVDAFFKKAYAPCQFDLTKTVIITRSNGKKAFIYNAKNVCGYLVQVIAKGVGEPFYEYDGVDGVDEFFEKYEPYYCVFFNSNLIADVAKFQNEIKQKFGTLQPQISLLLGTEYEKYLIKFSDDNKGLKFEIKEAETNTETKLPEVIDFGYFHGFSAYTLHAVLPKSVWAYIKPYATYHKGDAEDEEWLEDMGYYDVEAKDYKGWYYSKEALYALAKNGYKVSYQGFAVPYKKSEYDFYEGLKGAEKQHNEKIAAQKAEIDRKNGRINYVKKEFTRLWGEAKKLTENEVKEYKIRDLEEILCPKIGINGHNIYGGGIYLCQNEKFLFFVKNNGMDGDDWSQNNMDTGGAGAIVTALLKEGADIFNVNWLLVQIEKININDY